METSLSDPISAECPCGPDLEYDPEYLLLFTRAAPREEAQYGDFVSTPETINWAELERDARRLLMRSKDIRILVVLLRCRIQTGRRARVAGNVVRHVPGRHPPATARD